MPTQNEEVQEKAQKIRKRQELKDSVGEQVLRALGAPGDLLRLQVRHLWDQCYRVNVFVGLDASAARIAHSYFVLTNGEGSVIDSRPMLSKKY